MRAVVITEFGGPEVLQIAEVEEPTAGPGEVRIAVRAAGVNPLDWKIRSGFAPFPIQFPFVPGLEAAGVVDQVGPEVEGVQVGDEVLGLAQHGMAEYAVLTGVAHKPADMSWETAASLPVAAETAVRTLGLLGVSAGQTLLVGSAAGSVGTIAVQLAARSDVTVVGTAGEKNLAYVDELGATAILYGEGLVERAREAAPQGIDRALDCGGHGALPDMITLTGSPDRVLTIADMAARDLGVRFSGGGPEQRPDGVATVTALVGAGQVTVRTGPSFSPEQIAEAHQISQAGHSVGKPVIVFG